MGYKCSPDIFASDMRRAFDSGDDMEDAHIQADSLMCELLRSLGYGAGVDVFQSADKWYA